MSRTQRGTGPALLRQLRGCRDQEHCDRCARAALYSVAVGYAGTLAQQANLPKALNHREVRSPREALNCPQSGADRNWARPTPRTRDPLSPMLGHDVLGVRGVKGIRPAPTPPAKSSLPLSSAALAAPGARGRRDRRGARPHQ